MILPTNINEYKFSSEIIICNRMRNISSKQIGEVTIAGHVAFARIFGDDLIMDSTMLQWLPKPSARVAIKVTRDKVGLPTYHISDEKTYVEGLDGIRKYPIQVFDMSDEEGFNNGSLTFAILFTPNQQTDLQLWVDMHKNPIELSIRGGITHLLREMYLNTNNQRYDFHEGDYFSIQADEEMVLIGHSKKEWEQRLFEKGGCLCWLMHFNEIESIKQRIQSKNKDINTIDAKVPERDTISNKRVFVVHGRDDNMRKMVCNYLKELGLEPVVLFEQPNEGKTVIEKLERELQSVSYAVVLMSHCDEGKYRKDKDFRHRARQNVIAEAGFFMGAKGRNKVSLIYKKEKKGLVEKPSDFEGLSHIEYFPHSDWRIELKRELEKAGLLVEI